MGRWRSEIKEAGLGAGPGVGAPNGSPASAALSRAELGWAQSVIGPKKPIPEGVDEKGLVQFPMGVMADKTVAKNIAALVKAHTPGKPIPKNKTDQVALAVDIVRGRVL